MSTNFALNPGKHQAGKRGFKHAHNPAAHPTRGKKVKAAPRKPRNVKFFKEQTS